MPRIHRVDDPEGVGAIAPLQQGRGGLSAPFLVRAADERRYWCKVPNNPEHPRVPVNDHLVGRVGGLIEASTCDVALIRIPEDLAGWRFCSWNEDFRLEAGWAHGSVEVPGATETRVLEWRDADDNAKRHATLYAIYDWLAGEDPQWLICHSQDRAYYSHDHGSYFPAGPGWTVESLRRHVRRPFRLPFSSDGLDPGELMRLADRIVAVTEDELLDVVSELPASWPVGDEDLEALVHFLLERKGETADRLRAMIRGR